MPEKRPGPIPVWPRLPAGAMYRLHRMLKPNAFYRWLSRSLERHRRAYRIFAAAEQKTKSAIFGCRMCAECVLPATAYACPMTCPKQLRNGPCGGVSANGDCEVYPGTRCVWLIAYERASAQNRVDDLAGLQRPIDQRGWGNSSWVNYWLGRDEDLVAS